MEPDPSYLDLDNDVEFTTEDEGFVELNRQAFEHDWSSMSEASGPVSGRTPRERCPASSAPAEGSYTPRSTPPHQGRRPQATSLVELFGPSTPSPAGSYTPRSTPPRILQGTFLSATHASGSTATTATSENAREKQAVDIRGSHRRMIRATRRCLQPSKLGPSGHPFVRPSKPTPPRPSTSRSKVMTLPSPTTSELSLSDLSAEEREVYDAIMLSDTESPPERRAATRKPRKPEKPDRSYTTRLRICDNLPVRFTVYPPEVPPYKDPYLRGQPLRLQITVPRDCYDRKAHTTNWKWRAFTPYGKVVVRIDRGQQRCAKLICRSTPANVAPSDPRYLGRPDGETPTTSRLQSVVVVPTSNPHRPHNNRGSQGPRPKRPRQ